MLDLEIIKARDVLSRHLECRMSIYDGSCNHSDCSGCEFLGRFSDINDSLRIVLKILEQQTSGND